MSTITKEFTKEQLIEQAKKNIEVLRGAAERIPGASDAAVIHLKLAEITLASLEAEPVHQVLIGDAWVDLSKGAMESQKRVGAIVRTVYTAPPAPVSVPDELTREEYKRRFMEEDNFDDTFRGGWKACRDAMLQGSEPVKTANKLRDEVETIRNSGIEIDAEKIFAERDALNAPDCSCRTCRPITPTDMRFVVCPDCGNKRCPHANDHRNACTGSNEPGQEGSAYPAAPQQEVKP